MPSSSIHPAFGAPGIEPRWTRSDKQAVGTAYSTASRIWFTLAAGVVSELYYPTIDQPQVRDVQFLVSDGETFFHDERRNFTSHIEQIDGHALGYRVVSTACDQPYRIVKEIIADPHRACLLVDVRLEGDAALLGKLRLYALVAPHLGGGGRENSAFVDEVAGYPVLMAHRGLTWLALGCSAPVLRRSCGYVGMSDGWTDLSTNHQMDWQFDSAESGNIALTAQIDHQRGRPFTLAVAFGDSQHDAQNTLVQALGIDFAEHRQRFIEQWQRVCGHVTPLCRMVGDGGALYRRSHSLLLAHEDKAFPGAMIASLSIPWGQHKGDEDLGGYHLVWPRDLVHASTALLASGNTSTPYRSLVYLACSQNDDGGFYQNFWIDGRPYWTGVQLDQVSFAMLLAWRVRQAGALGQFDPYPMVMRAAGYLLRHGPATVQERWEENGGYSPSTLAANIAALCCAAVMAREHGDAATGQFLQDYADFLESHIERWTVTTAGTLLPGVPRHYIRILPVAYGDCQPLEDPNQAIVEIKNQPPGAPTSFAAKDVVDAGFLELVRYGIRRADDPLFVDSLAVVDHVLKVDTPAGPCWRRYNHDGYGEREDGGPFLGWGRGRAWPLLTGERAHYELAAGGDVGPLIRAMEGFAKGGLLPEQIWDAAPLPGERLTLGHPTGSAMPLVWAHAEYLTLLRSAADGVPFDLLPHVAEHYGSRAGCRDLEIWKTTRHARTVRAGQTLRVMAPAPFRLHWSLDDWRQVNDQAALETTLGIHYFDVNVPSDQQSPVRFTFFWPSDDRWEGRDYCVAIQ